MLINAVEISAVSLATQLATLISDARSPCFHFLFITRPVIRDIEHMLLLILPLA